jgi:hypothetical protein
MKKIEKVLITTAVIGMVGFSFALSILRGLPEAFDWEEDNLDDYS